MVGALTVGKKKYAAVEADILALNERSAALRQKLEHLVQADAEAFAPLAAAYRLPKETPTQQAAKAAALEAALDGACTVPLAVSDAGCAALFCKAAMEAAGLNVSINTRLMADRAKAKAFHARADALLAEYTPLADKLYEKLAHQLREE